MSFEIELQELITIFSLYQDKSEQMRGADLKLIEKNGGNKYLLQGLFTHANKGIRRASIEDRMHFYGSNEQTTTPTKSFSRLLWQALSDFTLRILIAASILSIILETSVASEADRSTSWIEGFSILLAVFVCALVTALNNYQKQKQFRKLNAITETHKTCTVIREHETHVINQSEIVTGDILYIREGMEIPVDGWLIEAAEIYADQSSMTGESEPVPKNILDNCLNTLRKHPKQELPSPVLVSGTKVASGQGKMVCLVVGKSSCIGKIRSLIEQKSEVLTPLQSKLQILASDIGKFGLYSAAIIVLVLLVRFTIERVTEKSWDNAHHLHQILDFFLIGITVIVVAIPEGLPVAVTLTLAYSVKKMLTDNNLVRRMQACETMGGANIICSDKTGTLTMNKMSVTVWWNDKLHEVAPYTDSRLDYYKNLHQSYQQLLQVNLFVNSSAELRPEQIGSSTQIALMMFGERIGSKYNKFRADYNAIRKFPFNSNRKRMSLLTQVQGKKYLLSKGASEIVLGSCKSWINHSTLQVNHINNEIKAQLQDTIVKMAEKGLRTIVLAYRQIEDENMDLTSRNESGIYKVQESDLILQAIFGVKDLPREQVPEAIRQCRRAGIRVKMVTGDNLVTAIAIAKDIGIIEPNRPSLCLEGPEFNRIIGGVVCSLCRTERCNCPTDPTDKRGPVRKDVIKNEEDFQRVLKHLDVLARSRPEDKYALVTGLINQGNVVAVTGDGTNDAPALKKADVGFAMGKSGTEIARDASSIVLLDDNFNSIVKAVLWGRNIYDSIKKFIQFQLTVNIVAVSTTLIGALVLKQNILTPIQMLWLNMIMDTLASLALATQSPQQQLLDRKPHARQQYIITKRMLKHILAQSFYQLLMIMILVFLGENFIPETPDDFDNLIAPNFSYKYTGGVVGGTVASGRLWGIFSNKKDYAIAMAEYGVPSRHFTVVFNSFVMMQIFNFFNSRKLYDQINIFEGLSKNWVFPMVVVMIFSLQVILVTFGSIAFSSYSYYGLSLQQWLICIGIGSGSLIVSVLTKLLPEIQMCMDKVDYETTTARVNRSYRLALKLREKPSKIQQNSDQNLSDSAH